MSYIFGIILAKAIVLVSRLRGSRGTALPGLVVEKIFPDFLGSARPKLGTVIMVTGTNGKTSTQTLLSHIIKGVYSPKVLVNSRGANLKRGLIAEIARRSNIWGTTSWDYSVFEIEEATFPRIAKEIKADYIVVTNFFRDQLDAYGEINRTKQHVLEAILSTPDATVIANFDDPQVSDLLSSISNKKVGVKLQDFQDFLNYEPLSSESRLQQITTHSSQLKKITFPKAELTGNLTPKFKFLSQAFELQLPGYHSYYSFALSFAVLAEIDKDLEKKIASIARVSATCPPAFGRGEVIMRQVNGKLISMQIFLVKNPVGFDLTLDLLAFTRDKFGLAILINDKIADGKDVSWLWDSKIEKLAALENVKHIYISGERALDMDLRIKYSGTNKTTSISNSTQELLSEFASGDTSDIKVIATYTAMNQFRDSL